MVLVPRGVGACSHMFNLYLLLIFSDRGLFVRVEVAGPFPDPSEHFGQPLHEAGSHEVPQNPPKVAPSNELKLKIQASGGP